MAAFRPCSLLCCLSLHFAVTGNILVKAMAMCLGWHMSLEWRCPVLCGLPCGDEDYSSLFSSAVDLSSFLAWALEFFVHPYIRCLILLFNIFDLLLCVWNLFWCWHKSEELLVEVTEKCAPKKLNPVSQGMGGFGACTWCCWHLW